MGFCEECFLHLRREMGRGARPDDQTIHLSPLPDIFERSTGNLSLTMDIPPSQFKALFGALRDGLAFICSRLDDQNSFAQERLEESNRHRTADSARIAEQISRLHTKDSEKRWERLWRQKAHRQQVLLTVVTFLAFLAAAIYAAIAARQLSVMDQTLQEATTQTRISQGNLNEIQKQTSLLRQQLIGTQGALIEVGYEFASLDNKLTITVTNRGVVTATAIDLTLEARRETINSGHVLDRPRSFKYEWPYLKGGETRTWYTSLQWGPQHGEVQPDKWTPDWPWNETTRLSGRITYFNGSRLRHR
jgi:hypothetical protein